MKKLILSLILLIPAITFAQYKPMNQPYLFNEDTKFANTVFLDTAMAGQGVYLVMDTITGEVKRDTVSAVINGDSILTIVRANVDTSGTQGLQSVTDIDSTTNNKIIFTNSFEQGGSLTASGQRSHAQGLFSTASGDQSHAQGFTTTASASNSHSEGNGTVASGSQSHAEGQGTEAVGTNSHAEGAFTTAYSYAEKAQGTFPTVYTPTSTFSISSTDRLWAVGNGLDTNNRNNALTMLKNGTTTIDTTWSYASDMSTYSFSGLEIPHAEWAQNTFALNSIDLQDVTENGVTTIDEIVLPSIQASSSGGLLLQSSGSNTVLNIGAGGGTNATFSGNVNMQNNRILNVPDSPTDSTDAINLNTLDSLALQTDTFLFDSTALVTLGIGEDTLLSVTGQQFIDVISLSVICVGGTPYTFSGDLVIKSENGTLSTPASTILTASGPLYRKASIQADADLGVNVIFDIQGSAASAGNKTFGVVVHYRVIKLNI